MGKDLKDYWKLEEHKLGETTFTHFADGTAHKNRMQGNDFVQSVMYTHGVTCFSCHDVHGTANNADLLKPANVMCLACHGPNSPNGPHAATIEAHTHHKSGSSGNECVACHMPEIEQTIADVNVRGHTFRFITPAEGERLKIPSGCQGCHADKGAAWATEQLRGMEERLSLASGVRTGLLVCPLTRVIVNDLPAGLGLAQHQGKTARRIAAARRGALQREASVGQRVVRCPEAARRFRKTSTCPWLRASDSRGGSDRESPRLRRG